MNKKPSDYNDKEVEALREHMRQQDERFTKMEKKFDEVLILLGGSLIGKTKGLVEVVDELSVSLENWTSKFAHAEKWRIRFMEGEAERKAMIEKKKETAEDRAYQEELKDKEIAELRRANEASRKANRIKNWIAAAAVAFTILKYIFDTYFTK